MICQGTPTEPVSPSTWANQTVAVPKARPLTPYEVVRNALIETGDGWPITNAGEAVDALIRAGYLPAGTDAGPGED